MFPTPGTVDEAALARRQLIAATFENIQFAARKNLDFLQGIIGHGVKPTYLLGGVTRSATFCQRFADLVNVLVNSTVETEATVSGLFNTCSVAAGDITSGASLKQKVDSQVRLSSRTPRKGMVEVLQRRYSKWLSMREKIKGL
jgi:sugar (pentulose or hexulose) kinase